MLSYTEASWHQYNTQQTFPYRADIGSMSELVIVIGWKILQSIIGSIGWDTIDNFPIINRMYIKTF